MDEREIRSLFDTHKVSVSKTDIWLVQSTPVIKHSALERLAASIGIVFDMPVVLRAERDEAVFLIKGTRKDGISDWSTGEALIAKEGVPGGNYKVSGKQASYLWAMAEKRGRDRVTIKLAGLHGAYSEDESDDFKRSNVDDTAGSVTMLPPVKRAPEPEISQLMSLGQDAADRGMAAFGPFWNGRTKEEREALGGVKQRDKWMSHAREIDAADAIERQSA